jgi:hypothetical protein
MASRFHQVMIVKVEAGSSVSGLQAYIERGVSRDLTTGQTYDFRHQEEGRPVAAKGCVGPAGNLNLDPRDVWDEALKREMTFDRKTKEWRVKKGNGGEGTAPQVAKHRVVAIPEEFSDAEKIEFAKDYAAKIAEENGTFASYAIHFDDGNPHVHIIESVRTFSIDEKGNPKFGNKPQLKFSDGQLLDKDLPMEHFIQFAERWSAERGLEIRWNDPPLRVTDEAKKALASDLYSVSERLTNRSSTFTERELINAARDDFYADDDDIALLLEHGDLIEIEKGLYTTRALVNERRAVIAQVEKMAGRVEFDKAKADDIAERLTFRQDQKAAFDHVLANDVSIVQGDPGTGKSHMLRGVAEYHRSEVGGRIIALSPTNKVKAALAADLKLDGDDRARTLHAELFTRDRATGEFVAKKTDWRRGDLIIVDEAAMVDDKRMIALIDEADRTGAKLVMVGDDKQLGAVERGGLYSEIRMKIGNAELTEITRQKELSDREASKALARGDYREALDHYYEKNAIVSAKGIEEQRAKIIRDWSAGERDNSFIYCGTNKNVDALNVAAQEIRRTNGELGEGREVKLFGDKKMMLYERDQVQFRRNNREQNYMNGHVGRVVAVGEKIAMVELEDKRLVEAKIDDLQLGYAGTVYRGQGATNRTAYYVHEAHTSDRKLSLVGLTRHKENLRIYVDREVTKSVGELAAQMRRNRSPNHLLANIDLAAHDKKIAARDSKPRFKAVTSSPLEQRSERDRRIDTMIAQRKKLDDQIKKIDTQIKKKSGFFRSIFNRAELSDLRLARQTADEARMKLRAALVKEGEIATAEKAQKEKIAAKPTSAKNSAAIDAPTTEKKPAATAAKAAAGEATGSGRGEAGSATTQTTPTGDRRAAIEAAAAKKEAEEKKKKNDADAARDAQREALKEALRRAEGARASNARLDELSRKNDPEKRGPRMR